jgi:hypothetical protein
MAARCSLGRHPSHEAERSSESAAFRGQLDRYRTLSRRIESRVHRLVQSGIRDEVNPTEPTEIDHSHHRQFGAAEVDEPQAYEACEYSLSISLSIDSGVAEFARISCSRASAAPSLRRARGPVLCRPPAAKASCRGVGRRPIGTQLARQPGARTQAPVNCPREMGSRAISPSARLVQPRWQQGRTKENSG